MVERGKERKKMKQWFKIGIGISFGWYTGKRIRSMLNGIEKGLIESILDISLNGEDIL